MAIAVTSGTYLFQNLPGDKYLIEAYERIGIERGAIDELKITAFLNTANFVLSSWTNNRGGLNLYTVKEAMIGLVPNQTTYSLPSNLIDILEATLRQSIRNLGGTALSSAGGVAANAFDGNSATACTQTAPNGYISYTWSGTSYAISMVGIQSNVTTTYNLVFEYSNDNATWVQVGSAVSQTYTQGQISWFVIALPVAGSYFRVRETGGGTLNVQELYFNTFVRDTILTRISRAEYTAIPLKNQTGRPSCFIVYRNVPPFVRVWQAPTVLYNCMYFTYESQIEDFYTLINTPGIPSRYMDAFMWACAYALGVKNSLTTDKLAMLKNEAQESYALAKEEDRERVPLRAYGDYLQGWTRV